jgi:hypothetical protein
MFTDLRTSLPATLVAAGCCLLVTIRVVRAPAPVIPAPANDEQRWSVAAAIASQEQAWVKDTTQNFPSDLWSQRDDFHGREYRKVVEVAKDRQLRVEDVLRAIDDDIHRQQAKGQNTPDDRNARAIPCKPRPFYD